MGRSYTTESSVPATPGKPLVIAFNTASILLIFATTTVFEKTKQLLTIIGAVVPSTRT